MITKEMVDRAREKPFTTSVSLVDVKELEKAGVWSTLEDAQTADGSVFTRRFAEAGTGANVVQRLEIGDDGRVVSNELFLDWFYLDGVRLGLIRDVQFNDYRFANQRLLPQSKIVKAAQAKNK